MTLFGLVFLVLTLWTWRRVHFLKFEGQQLQESLETLEALQRGDLGEATEGEPRVKIVDERETRTGLGGWWKWWWRGGRHITPKLVPTKPIQVEQEEEVLWAGAGAHDGGV